MTRTTGAPDRADEFYVGYLPAAPKQAARAVRAVVAALVIGGAALGAGLAAAFERPAAAEWSETVEKFRGRIIERPYPMLRMVDDAGRARLVLLVAVGKHGASDLARGLDGQVAEVEGAAIRRDGRLMIEVTQRPMALGIAASDPTAAPIRSEKRTASVIGEIIDPKCFMGVMKPGEGKLHKGCAIRCISGGIPPMLASRSADGAVSYFLLVDSEGRPANTLVLPYVAEPVELSGQVERVDDLDIFTIAPGGIRPQ